MTDDKDAAQAALKDLPVQAGQHYRHFKGGEYEVVAVAIKEDTLEPLVLYRSRTKDYLWSRTVTNFIEHVDRPEHGYQGPRFVLSETK